MAERSLSLPSSRGLAAAGALNPFYSERLRAELALRASRPLELPSPGSEGVLPVMDASQTGKGRGAVALGPRAYETPCQTAGAMEPQDFGPPRGLQSQGAMPMETTRGLQTMGSMKSQPQQPVDANGQGIGELQRDLEVELVDFLRQQNARLLQEVEELKAQAKGSGASSSPWSTNGEWSGIDDAVSAARPAKRCASRSPRPNRKREFESPVRKVNENGGNVKNDGSQLQFTPNGTRVPDLPPPRDDCNMIPQPPPMPPFPDPPGQSSMVDVNLDSYETMDEKNNKGRLGDVTWKPSNEKVMTPHEAKTVWLEREVQSLRSVLEKVADGRSFDISKAWPLKPGQTVWSANIPEPRVASAAANCGSDALHSIGHGELSQQDRAAAGLLHSTGLGAECHQGRALRGTVLGDVSQQDRALHGIVLGDRALQASALHGTVLGDGAQQARALHGTPIGLQHADHGGDLPGQAQCLPHGKLLEEEQAEPRPSCPNFPMELRLCSMAIGCTCVVQSCGTFPMWLEMVGSNSATSPNLLPGVEGINPTPAGSTSTTSS